MARKTKGSASSGSPRRGRPPEKKDAIRETEIHSVGLYPDLDDSHSDRDFVERCRRDFLRTGNPLHAWEAWGTYRLTTRRGPPLDPPSWLFEYLDGCGRRLIGTWREVPGTQREKRIGGGITLRFARKMLDVPARAGEGPGAIGRALGFKEGLAKAREHWGGEYDARERLAAQAVEMMWSEGLSLDAVASRIERERGPARGYYPPRIAASRATVTRAVREARRYALRTMQARLREANGSIPPVSEVARAYSRLCMQRASKP